MRHKIPEEKKKDKFTITIDEKLAEMMNKFLEDKDISNKSKYIEDLIRKDMEQKGLNTKREF